MLRDDRTPLPWSAGLMDWVHKRLLSFGLVLGVVFLLVVSMSVTTLLDLTLGRFARTRP